MPKERSTLLSDKTKGKCLDRTTISIAA